LQLTRLGYNSLVLKVVLRGTNRTLTGEEADEVCDSIVAACRTNHAAELRA